MGKLSPKLGMWLPEKGETGTDDFENVDLDVDNNMDLIDQNINLRIATSGNRPSKMYPGMQILETDTKTIRLWTGTEWLYVGDDNTSIGRKAYQTLTTDGANQTSASGEVIYTFLTFDAEADRRYWVETVFHIVTVTDSAAAGAQGTFRCRWSTGTSVGTTDTALGAGLTANVVNTQGNSLGERNFVMYELVPNFTGPVSIAMTLNVTSSDTMKFRGNADQTNILSVRDVGSI